MKRTLPTLLGLLAAVEAGAQSPISIDGCFDDWEGITPLWSDGAGDAGADFLSLGATHDGRFLFLLVEAGGDFDLSENNDITIYIDGDDDAATGLAIGGIGAELEWRAGSRDGTFRGGGGQSMVFHDDIRFRGAPTVTSRRFEIAIGRDTLPDGSNPLISGDGPVRILIIDGNGDRMPDAGQVVSYSLAGGVVPAGERPFARADAGDLRIVTHNVLNDNLFDPRERPSFQRLYTAVAPDIFHLQEIYNNSAQETADQIASWLPGPWFSAGVADCRTVSRFPVLGSWNVSGNLAVLLDTSSRIGAPMLCINAHLPCCSNDSGRQDESDAIIGFIRDAYEPGGVVSLSADSPVMIVGDLNLVGFARQLDTLLSGDISDEADSGPDRAPDPDGSRMGSVVPRQTEKRMGYTWRNDNSSFWPGQLDFMIYSNSILTPANSYTVYTPEMSGASLAANGLLSGDTLASDHLLFVADFRRACEYGGDPETIDVLDLLAYLNLWFALDAAADRTGDGATDVLDLLDDLDCWFAGTGRAARNPVGRAGGRAPPTTTIGGSAQGDPLGADPHSGPR